MGLESASFIHELVITNPPGTDQKSTADDHLRLIKKTVTQTFPNIAGEMSASHGELNMLVGISTTSSVEARLTKYSASISALNTAVSANSDSISAINTTISGITTTLTNYGDSISALNTAVATHDDSISALNTAIANRLSADATAVAAVRATSASAALNAVRALSASSAGNVKGYEHVGGWVGLSGTAIDVPSGWSSSWNSSLSAYTLRWDTTLSSQYKISLGFTAYYDAAEAYNPMIYALSTNAVTVLFKDSGEANKACNFCFTGAMKLN